MTAAQLMHDLDRGYEPGRYVFLSYKNDEYAQADKLRKHLEEYHGLTVWIDKETQCGGHWATKIDAHLAYAGCVVVQWSDDAVKSRWVRFEAAAAVARNAYVPCAIEDVELDAPFDRMVYASLTDWDGETDHRGMEQLVAKIKERVPDRPWWRWLLDLLRRYRSAFLMSAFALLMTAFAVTATTMLVKQGSQMRTQLVRSGNQMRQLKGLIEASTDQMVKMERLSHQAERALYPLTDLSVELELTLPYKDARVKEFAELLRLAEAKGSFTVEPGDGNYPASGTLAYRMLVPTDHIHADFSDLEGSGHGILCSEQPRGMTLICGRDHELGHGVSAWGTYRFPLKGWSLSGTTASIKDFEGARLAIVFDSYDEKDLDRIELLRACDVRSARIVFGPRSASTKPSEWSRADRRQDEACWEYQFPSDLAEFFAP